MKKNRLLCGLAASIVLVQACPAFSTCGPAQVCSDMQASLVGEIDAEDITVSWSTAAEDSTVAEYRIYRYNCAYPLTCSTLVVTVRAVTSCGVSHSYGYVDSPASPVSQWKYSVEVWRSNQTRACAYDVTPQ